MNLIAGNLPLLQAGGSGQLVTTFVTFGLVFVIFYFLIIRPQNKKQKEAKMMLAALKKGDKIVSIGGIRGTIQTVRDDAVVVKVDDATKLEFSKSAIATVLNAAAVKPEKKVTETAAPDATSETKSE